MLGATVRIDRGGSPPSLSGSKFDGAAMARPHCALESASDRRTQIPDSLGVMGKVLLHAAQG